MRFSKKFISLHLFIDQAIPKFLCLMLAYIIASLHYIFTCEDMKFSRESSLGISLVFYIIKTYLKSFTFHLTDNGKFSFC